MAVGANDWDYNYEAGQIKMPHVDANISGVPFTYYGYGTSMAAPQVSGAAALYRAERPTATAQETKAALLLSAFDDMWLLHGTTTFFDRNTYGLGFVNDERLAQYAGAQGQWPPGSLLGQAVTVNPQQPVQEIVWNVDFGNAYYVLALVWPRIPQDDGGPSPLANLDLEVWNAAGDKLLASSTSLRNSYERVVFKPYDTSGPNTIKVRVLGTELHDLMVTGYLAGWVTSDPPVPTRVTGAVSIQPQEPDCKANAHRQEVTRVVPYFASDYFRNAWGTHAFFPPPPANPHHAATGYGGRIFARPGNPTNDPTVRVHTILHKDAVGGPFQAHALALRTTRPFTGSAGQPRVRQLYLYETPTAPQDVQNPSGANPFVPPSQPIIPPTNPVTLNLEKVDWSARHWEAWTVLIPFPDNPFSYTGADHLGIWMEIERFDFQPSAIYTVDALNDEGVFTPPLYATHFGGTDGGSSAVLDGVSYVFGFVAPGTADLTPRLEVVGEPSLGQSFLLRLIQAPIANPGPAPLILLMATQPLGAMVGPCRTFEAAVIADQVLASPMGDYAFKVTVPNNKSFLFQEFYYQVVTDVTIPGTPWAASNAVRVRIGGHH